MALQTPVLNEVVVFDATTQFEFKFSYQGNQAIKNNLVIYKTLDDTLVYDQIIETFSLKHTLPANTLINDTEYKAKIRVADIANTWSDYSELELFYCTTPATIAITNITNGKISNQTYTFQGSFTHANDTLEKYFYLLYDKNSTLLETFEVKYDGLLNQEITGLDNNENFKVELKTVSTHGMVATSGLVPFYTEYIAPQLSLALNAENNPDNASIKITAHIVRILGEVSSGTISYIDGTKLNCSNGTVLFSDGIIPFGDFTKGLWLENIIKDVEFIEFISNNGRIKLKYSDNRIIAEKYLVDNLGNMIGKKSVYTSNEIVIIPTDNVFIWLEHKENRISIRSEVIV